MKTKIRDIVSVSIFMVLTVVAVLFVKPAYIGLVKSVSMHAAEIKENVEDRFSMKISYKSLSPSILSAVNFREVTLTGTEGNQIASISKIRLEYKLLKLLRGDFTNGFKSLVIDGVDVSGSALVSLIEKNTSGKNESIKKENSDSFTDFDYSLLFPDFPLNVLLKNVNVSYADDDFSTTGHIRKMNFDYSNRQKLLSFSSDIVVSAKVKNENYTGNVNLEGKIFEGFENSTCSLSVSNLTNGNIKLNRMNFLASYNNRGITCTTIKNSFPVFVNAAYSFESGAAHGEVKIQDLSASSIIQVQKKNDWYKNIAGLRLSTDSSVSYSLKDRNLEYSSITGLSVPDELIPSGVDVSVNLKGDEKSLRINNVSVKGKNYDLFGELDYVFSNMNLSGSVEIPEIRLPNGAVISSEVFFDPLKKGFMGFIPQLFIDENVYTALQLTVSPEEDSIDFSFEGYDYSHFEADTPGKISADGSYLIPENYIQTSLSVNSFFLDSAWLTAISFLPEDTKISLEGTAGSVKDFMFSTDGYFSTDFRSMSFNVPYILLASTSKDNQALLLSFDGNEQSVNISQADLILGKQAYHATGSLDFLAEAKEMFMILDLNSGSIPYHFTGTLTNNIFSLSGDYNTNLRLDFSRNGLFSGIAQCENLPLFVSAIDASVLATLNSEFSYSDENGIEVALSRFELEEAGNQLRIKPHLAVSGNVNRYGASMNSIVYSDLYSQLEGNADVFFAFTDGIPGTAGMELKLKSMMTEESVSLSANVSNPDMIPFSLDSLLKDYYLDASVLVNNLNMNRFTLLKSNNNLLTASLYISGTAEHPYVSASLDNLSLLVSTEVMKMSGSAVMENHDVMLNEFKFNFGNFEINKVSGNFDLDSFNGLLMASFEAQLMEETLFVPFRLETSDVIKKKGRLLPAAFAVSLSSDEIYGTFVRDPKSFSVSAFCNEDGINIITSDNLGIFASYNKTGEVFAVMNSEDFCKMRFDGNFNSKTGDVSGQLSDFDLNLVNVASIINLEKIINFYSGRLSGNLKVSGTIDNPLLTGLLTLDKPEFNVPYCLPDKLATEKFLILFDNGEMNVPETKLRVKKTGELFAWCRIIFDKWRFDKMEVSIRTEKSKYVPLKMEIMKGFNITGDANVVLNMVLENGDFDLTGDILAEKTELYVDLPKLVSSVNADVPPEQDVNFRCSLNVKMGTHVRVNVDPLLRAIFVPGGTLGIVFDAATNQLSMYGLLLLKSGDVSYLNRNFYVKEGSLKFNPSDPEFNPIINVRAETRERDENGENVTISLNAQNQFIRDFNPKFSSVPAKSEMEIQTLLGQIAVADSENVGNFLFAAGDYALQSLVGRKFENTLRDFLNFDIFSLRTNIIQNTLNFSLSNRNSSETMNAGNFFDNSTVYIGKYLGSALYIDAMLNLQYDDRRFRDATAATVGGMIFKPEFGMELESPFGNIRWNIAPDIDALMNKQYVPASSVSLSWKLSF